MNNLKITQSFLNGSEWKTSILTTLLGWIPLLPGLGIRYLLYPTIFKKMGRSVKIYPDVRLKDARKIEVGFGVVFGRGVEIDIARDNYLQIDDRVNLTRDVAISCTGQNNEIKLANLVSLDRGVDLRAHGGSQIHIGDRTYIGPYTCISGYGTISIGKDCLIASHSSIYAHNYKFSDPSKKIKEQGFVSKGIAIEDNCWLGSGVKVVDGVTIGEGSVVAFIFFMEISVLNEIEISLEKQLKPEIKNRIIRKALLSRCLEQKLLELYSQGKLFGTVHTCIGQEFSGAVITEFLQPRDSIFSNHRCHGHFLSWTENVTGLIAEIMGKQAGVCSGRGGSQHLCQDGFYSNGIQGGIVPVATGLAFARKLDGKGKISTVFIGDGTLGEGVIYEAFNLAAKWELPLLVVLENNGYAQSTCQTETLAGDICNRAAAFGIRTAKGDTWNWEQLYAIAEDVVNYVRDEDKPAFLQIDTFRLKAHSKGDDNRPRSVVEPYEQKDPLNLLLAESNPEIIALQQEIEQLIDKAVAEAEASPYPEVNLPTIPEQKIEWQEATVSKQRVVKALNQAFKDLMSEHPKMLFIGEDVKSPYGGAFKVAQELSDLFAERVFNTPISEAAIVGLATGLAMEGYYPFVEIMFGDFTTLVLDQILNHASKFRYMYDEQVTANAVIRTPMGGGRGYGPTHSQTLDRHFLGIPGLRAIAINNLLEPKPIYQTILETSLDPTLIIENKLLYSQYLREELPEGFKRLVSNEPLPTVWIKPETVAVDVTLIGYGGMSETLVKVCDRLFEEHDLIAQIICPTQIYPFNIKPFLEIIRGNRQKAKGKRQKAKGKRQKAKGKRQEFLNYDFLIMKQEILVPRVNTNDDEVELVHWYVEDKQFVEVGQEIADVESSKAVMSIESEASGYILTSAKVGDSVGVGAPLATIYTELAELEADLNGSAAAPVKPDRSTLVSEPAVQPVAVVTSGAVETKFDSAQEFIPEVEKPQQDLVTTTVKPSFGFTRFSPSAKEYLKQNDFDASQFEGMGLVSVEAIEQILGKKFKPPSPSNVGAAALATQEHCTTVVTPSNNNLRSEKVSKAKQIEISLLSAGQAGGINSSLTVHFNSAGIRQTLVETGSLNGQILPLILFEFSRLLEEYPVFNAYYEAGRIYYYDRIDIGLAMDLGKGLKVPIFRNANLLSPVEIQETVTDYATQYLENRLDPADLMGGTVTVTDLSNEGILHFQPLLNQNQSIILGIGGDSSIDGYPLTLTVVFDHRLSAGREVASFLNELKKRLLSYAISNLPQTQKLAKTKNVQCSKCLIDLHSLYQKYGSEALMQLHINEQGETDYICHVCMGGF